MESPSRTTTPGVTHQAPFFPESTRDIVRKRKANALSQLPAEPFGPLRTRAQYDHDHAQHHDLNLKSAYVHVVADAATSVLAIVALAGGWLYGWSWLDPVMGIVGALVVALWAKRLIADTGKVLLDREMDHPVVDEIREAIEDRGRISETRV